MTGGILTPVAFGYNATQAIGRRQAPQVRTVREDAELIGSKRAILSGTTADLWRNFEIAKWMVSLHTAYVSRFDVLVNTGNRAVDQELSDLFDWHGQPEQFDIAQRHSRDAYFRLFEIAKVFCGDAAFIKLAGGNVQGLPGKRIAWSGSFENGSPPKDWQTISDTFSHETGLKINQSTGAVEQCIVCRWSKDGRTLYFDHIEDWPNLLYDGYFVDMDQHRGISPLACAVNRLQDMYESLEWVQLKIKLHALFGLKFTRQATTGVFDTTGQTATPPVASGTNPKHTVSLEKGVNIFDLDPGDDVSTIESNTPSSGFLEYTGIAISVALLALDIPVTFFDSRRSSFSARIADSNQYEFLASEKRKKNRAVLKRYSDWKIAQWMNSSADVFKPLQSKAAAAGLSVRQLQRKTDWVGAEAPWVDQLKQLEGVKLALQLGLTSRQREARKRGMGHWHQIAAELKQESDELGPLGVIEGAGMSPAAPEPTPPPDPNEPPNPDDQNPDEAAQ